MHHRLGVREFCRQNIEQLESANIPFEGITVQESPPPQRRLGLIMIAIAWLLGLALAAGLFQGSLEQRRNPNSELEVRGQSVRLEPNHQHHYLAPATINGSEVTLLIDTGASDVVIPGAVARRLELPKLGQGMAMTANGPTRITRTRLEQLQIGPISLRDVSASIAENYTANEILFGMSALRQLDFRSQDGALILEQ